MSIPLYKQIPADDSIDYLDEIAADDLASDPEFQRRWEEVEIASRLADCRKAASLTQCELAQRMGVSQARISEMEHRPSRVSLGRILSYLKETGFSVSFDPRQDRPEEGAAPPQR